LRGKRKKSEARTAKDMKTRKASQNHSPIRVGFFSHDLGIIPTTMITTSRGKAIMPLRYAE